MVSLSYERIFVKGPLDGLFPGQGNNRIFVIVPLEITLDEISVRFNHVNIFNVNDGRIATNIMTYVEIPAGKLAAEI